jgi:hypothetical protein
MTAPLVATMTREEYESNPGLNYSGLRDLAISPLRFWHKWLNPERVEEPPTPAMELGSALHAAVLEPHAFDKRYYCALDVNKIEGALVTMDDIRKFVKSNGMEPDPKYNKHKDALINWTLSVFPSAPIVDVLQLQHDTLHAGKVRFDPVDWDRLAWMAKILTDEPRIQQLLNDKSAKFEVTLLAVDEETGIHLKGRLDMITDHVIPDIKTFSQKDTQDIGESINRTLYYSRHHWQAFFYARLRGWPERWNGTNLLAFIESEAPHETRLRSLSPKMAGQANLYWLEAQRETRRLIRVYKEHMDNFGVDRAWRYAQEATPLVDEDLPSKVIYGA